MRILLEVKSGPNAGSKQPLVSGQTLRIGRRTEAEHSFPGDKQMSGLHFAIEYGDKGCRLLDLGSSNGTYLNGSRVTEATLANGDEIRAGTTTFVIRFLRDDVPAAQPPAPVVAPAAPASSQLKPGELPSFPVYAPPPAAPETFSPPKAPESPAALPRLEDLLRKDFQPLFALLDASREPSVLKAIYESKEEYQSLYEGAQGAQLAHFAPYLIRIPANSALIPALAQRAWSKSWGIFLTCDLPLKELRTHFRHFLNVRLPDGTQVYFRYYDPRVLRLFLPTCLPEETNQFFGPVKQFLMEAEDAKVALHFTRGPKGAAQKELLLAQS